MHFHIFIQQKALFQASQVGGDSALARLLARAQHETLNRSMEALLCQAAGVKSSSESAEDSLPFAAISYLGEDSPPGSPAAEDGCFLFADPVHLVLQRDSFSLSGPVPMVLTAAESACLLSSLNEHFAADGLKFIAGAYGQWYVNLKEAPKIVTRHPALAIDRDINVFLPQGPDAGRWNQLVNEIQMLLFTHPVNQEREANGLLPCNSLWFWGGGKLPEKSINAGALCCGTGPLIRGLGKLGKVQIQAVPTALSCIGRDEAGWMVLNNTHLADEGLFQLVGDALKKNLIHTLHLYFSVNGKVVKASLRRRDMWKFWRKNLAVATYFEV